MKKILIFMLCVLTAFSLTSCSWFESPAEAKIVGCGYIQNDNGLLFVEIDGAKYAPTYVYTNKSTRDGKTTMEPIDGMKVTVFYTHGHDTPKFIAGDHSEEYLEDYFSANYTLLVVFLIIISSFFISYLIPDKKR